VAHLNANGELLPACRKCGVCAAWIAYDKVNDDCPGMPAQNSTFSFHFSTSEVPESLLTFGRPGANRRVAHPLKPGEFIVGGLVATEGEYLRWDHPAQKWVPLPPAEPFDEVYIAQELERLIPHRFDIDEFECHGAGDTGCYCQCGAEAQREAILDLIRRTLASHVRTEPKP
jgi:hypothetical protein